jgi:ABC-type Fe3+-hydroxamate transport system substrate-binding protein
MKSVKARVAVFAALVCGAAALAAIGLATWGNGPVFRTLREAAAGEAPYSVSMSPMGEVRFKRVPRRVVTLDANYNDTLVALGQGSKLIATGYQNNFYDGFYAKLGGLKTGIDPRRLAFLSGGAGGTFDKELFYSLHADVHHIDPLQLAASRGWSQSDVEEISRNVGPFFANRYSRDNSYTGKAKYEYYSLWELAAKVGEVYRRAETIARLKAVYDDMVGKIQAKLPPVEKRPRVGLIYYGNERFTPYSIDRGGFGQAQYRDVGVRDAFESIAAHTYGGSASAALDKEGLLALNPDVLIVPFAIYPAGKAGTSRADYERLLALRDDPLIQRLSAFRSGRVYPGGTPLQGPIFYLFQIEMAAKQIYPDLFGPYRDDQNYLAAEQLFDRRRVADILRQDAQ